MKPQPTIRCRVKVPAWWCVADCRTCGIPIVYLAHTRPGPCGVCRSHNVTPRCATDLMTLAEAERRAMGK
jgi:hypothetical protein